MRRLEMVLKYYNSMQTGLLTGVFFMIYLLVFLEASMITIFLFATKLYLFGILVLGFLFTISIIAGLKMRKFNKEAKKIKKDIEELGYLKK